MFCHYEIKKIEGSGFMFGFYFHVKYTFVEGKIIETIYFYFEDGCEVILGFICQFQFLPACKYIKEGANVANNYTCSNGRNLDYIYMLQ